MKPFKLDLTKHRASAIQIFKEKGIVVPEFKIEFTKSF